MAEPSPKNNDVPAEKVSLLRFAHEALAGAATLLQPMPVVGGVCSMLLSLEQQVQTAKSNKQELIVLLQLCDVVIGALLSRKSNVAREAFASLDTCVKRAKIVAEQCCGCGVIKRSVLSRRMSNDISAIRNDVLAFCTTLNLAINNDVQVGVCVCVSHYFSAGR